MNIFFFFWGGGVNNDVLGQGSSQSKFESVYPTDLPLSDLIFLGKNLPI